MKTSRKDITRDKRQSKCLNSTLLGFSSYTLKYGDFFIYEESYTDGTKQKRFAKCHGRVKPEKSLGNEPVQYYILAQVISFDLRYDMERWIEPKDVIETVPAERMNDHVKKLFIELEEKQ